jgi:hypothetical protein
VNPGAGSTGIVFGVSGYNGPATVKVNLVQITDSMGSWSGP